MSQEHSKNVRYEFSKVFTFKALCLLDNQTVSALQMNTPTRYTSLSQGRSRRLVTKDRKVVGREDQIVKVLGLCRLVEIGSK